MKTFCFRSAALLGLLSLSIAHGAVLFDTGTTALSLANPTQLGRLSRNGTPQDWTSEEPYPGSINATTSYHYETFVIAPPSYYPYIQITMDSVSINTFASAYLNAYLPGVSFQTNWLGDAGTSGNFFGTDPLTFQVIVPAGNSLVVVVNNTAAGNVGVGDPFDILVEGFTDTEFDDTVPEPTSIVLSGTGVGLIGLLVRRQRSRVC